MPFAPDIMAFVQSDRRAARFLHDHNPPLIFIFIIPPLLIPDGFTDMGGADLLLQHGQGQGREYFFCGRGPRQERDGRGFF